MPDAHDGAEERRVGGFAHRHAVHLHPGVRPERLGAETRAPIGPLALKPAEQGGGNGSWQAPQPSAPGTDGYRRLPSLQRPCRAGGAGTAAHGPQGLTQPAGGEQNQQVRHGSRATGGDALAPGQPDGEFRDHRHGHDRVPPGTLVRCAVATLGERSQVSQDRVFSNGIRCRVSGPGLRSAALSAPAFTRPMRARYRSSHCSSSAGRLRRRPSKASALNSPLLRRPRRGPGTTPCMAAVRSGLYRPATTRSWTRTDSAASIPRSSRYGASQSTPNLASAYLSCRTARPLVMTLSRTWCRTRSGSSGAAAAAAAARSWLRTESVASPVAHGGIRGCPVHPSETSNGPGGAAVMSRAVASRHAGKPALSARPRTVETRPQRF